MEPQVIPELNEMMRYAAEPTQVSPQLATPAKPRNKTWMTCRCNFCTDIFSVSVDDPQMVRGEDAFPVDLDTFEAALRQTHKVDAHTCLELLWKFGRSYTLKPT